MISEALTPDAFTWQRHFGDGQSEALKKLRAGKFNYLAKEHKALFAAVGPAWEKALIAKPGLKLHSPDGSHPNTSDRYLTMCVFYALLTGKSPIGLPPQLGLAAGETKQLQQAAWVAHTEWSKKMQDAGIKLPQ